MHEICAAIVQQHHPGCKPEQVTTLCQCRLLAKPACRPGQAAYRTNVVVAAGKSIAQKEKSLQTEILFKPFEEVRLLCTLWQHIAEL